MKRRNILAGIAAAVGTTVTIGSGAFDVIEADRSAEVEIVNDDDAYLQLRELDSGTFENAAFTDESGGIFRLDFNEVTLGGGRGPNPHSTYEFDKVFAVTNKGSQEVEFWLDEFSFPESNKVESFDFYVGDNPDKIIDGDDGALEISDGDSAIVGIKIETKEEVDTEQDDFTGTAELEANKDSDAEDIYTYDGTDPVF